MSTFDYLKQGEAVAAAHESTPESRRIIGLKAVDADRFLTPTQGGTRTAAGYLRKPQDPWRAHSYVEKLFKTIDRVEWAKEAEPGTVEVSYADETSELISKYDLLCVERPI
jgi:hypothetical protein